MTEIQKEHDVFLNDYKVNNLWKKYKIIKSFLLMKRRKIKLSNSTSRMKVKNCKCNKKCYFNNLNRMNCNVAWVKIKAILMINNVKNTNFQKFNR